MLKLDIDFITFWNDPMQDGSITIINIFELFKETALTDADKNCADSDDCGVWERWIFFNITFIGINARGNKILQFVCKIKISIKLCGISFVNNKKTSIEKGKISWKSKLFFFRLWFLLNHSRSLSFYVLLKTFLFSWGIERENRTEINFSVDKSFFHK